MNVASLPASPQTSALPAQAKSAVKSNTATAVSQVSFSDELFQFMGASEEPAVPTPDPSSPLPTSPKAAAAGEAQFPPFLAGTQLASVSTSAAKTGLQPTIDLGKQPLTAAKLPAGVQTVSQNQNTKAQPPVDGPKIGKKSGPKPVTEGVKTNTGLDTAKLSLAALQNAVPQNSIQTHDEPKATPQPSPVDQISEVEPLGNSSAISSSAPVPTGDLAFAVRVKASSESAAKPVESKTAAQAIGEPLVTLTSDEDSTPALSVTEAATSDRVALGTNTMAHAATSAPIHAIEEQHKSQSEGQPQSHGEGSSETHVALNTSAIGNSKETPSAKAIDFEEKLGQVSSEPVKSAHVQLGSDDSKVDIRLVERGGSLSVSVRSTDSSLTKALSDHTNELASRLTADHYKTELWTPSNASKGDSGRGGGGAHSGGERQGGSAGDGSGKRQNPQGNSKQNQEPEWVQEFESIPGTFQKRIDYTWPQ